MVRRLWRVLLFCISVINNWVASLGNHPETILNNSNFKRRASGQRQNKHPWRDGDRMDVKFHARDQTSSQSLVKSTNVAFFSWTLTEVVTFFVSHRCCKEIRACFSNSFLLSFINFKLKCQITVCYWEKDHSEKNFCRVKQKSVASIMY